ncbi:hypothetical protein GWI33_015508 [Rhynchophorus ferrugineus]|uniref:Uncharacterized protein n=1 Tax=Rhynchophorus ferrugineus TaxID=354439 RepID=A0A834I0Q6_RHYFE|nr:hypothetical protein GWI33_015508 [Rhynchophorus ferrugineus]
MGGLLSSINSRTLACDAVTTSADLIHRTNSRNAAIFERIFLEPTRFIYSPNATCVSDRYAAKIIGNVCQR